MPSREEPGQAGQVSLDPSAVPPGVDVELIEKPACDGALYPYAVGRLALIF